MVVVTSFPKAAQETGTSRSWVCSDPKSQEAEQGHGTDPEGSPEPALPLKSLFPSPETLQNTERLLLDKAELEAEVERLKEQDELLRTRKVLR